MKTTIKSRRGILLLYFKLIKLIIASYNEGALAPRAVFYKLFRWGAAYKPRGGSIGVDTVPMTVDR